MPLAPFLVHAVPNGTGAPLRFAATFGQRRYLHGIPLYLTCLLFVLCRAPRYQPVGSLCATRPRFRKRAAELSWARERSQSDANPSMGPDAAPLRRPSCVALLSHAHLIHLSFVLRGRCSTPPHRKQRTSKELGRA